MKLLSILLIILLLSSCESTHILSELKPAKPVVAIRQNEGNTRDAEWERIMRLFADHDIPIKTVDKSSGFIESDVMSFVNAYAIDGYIRQDTSEAIYVVAQRETYNKVIIQPTYITGQIKIFVLPGDGKTESQVSIENLKDFYTVNTHYSHSNLVTVGEMPHAVHSTGALEHNIADYIALKTDSLNINLLKGTVINPRENRATAYEATTRGQTAGAIVSAVIVGGGAVGLIILLDSAKRPQ